MYVRKTNIKRRPFDFLDLDFVEKEYEFSPVASYNCFRFCTQLFPVFCEIESSFFILFLTILFMSMYIH